MGQVVNTQRPSGLNRAELNSLECNNGEVKGSPVAASQIRAVLSFEAVTTRRLSGLKEI